MAHDVQIVPRARQWLTNPAVAKQILGPKDVWLGLPSFS
jgi:hypothetical protein